LRRSLEAEANAVFEEDYAVAEPVPALLAVVGDDDRRGRVPVIPVRTNRRV
jgi:hypothetical protein